MSSHFKVFSMETLDCFWSKNKKIKVYSEKATFLSSAVKIFKQYYFLQQKTIRILKTCVLC